MSSEWVICRKCSLKYRVREQVCPRCDQPFEEGQLRWTEQRGPSAPEPRSKLVWVVPLVVLALAGVAAVVVWLPPGFFNPSLPQKIARACEAKTGPDCSCVGEKTFELMSPEQRAASFERENPEVRELMLTAGQLCLKERLVTKCQETKQGTEFQCICIVDGAVNAFTGDELETVFSTLPPRYISLRAGCVR